MKRGRKGVKRGKIGQKIPEITLYIPALITAFQHLRKEFLV
jgi:hypothetical protein